MAPSEDAPPATGVSSNRLVPLDLTGMGQDSGLGLRNPSSL